MIETKFFYDVSRGKRDLWNKTNAKRKGWERKYYMLFRTVLNREFKKLADRIDITNYNNIDLPDRIIDEFPVKLLMLDLYKNVGVSFAKDAYRELSVSAKQRKDENDLEDYWMHEMDKYIKTTATDKITSIAVATRIAAKGIIRQILEQAVNEGWGADVIAREIRKQLVKQGVEMNTWRALRIARTEIMTASNYGSYAGAESLGVPLEKYWIATYDQRTRDTHEVIEQQNPKDMDSDFTVGNYQMSRPGDPRGGPEEVINCRCAIAFGVKGM